MTGANSSITVAGAAAGITLPTSVTLLNNLTVTNTSGLAVSVDLTIGGTLTLSGGPVTAGRRRSTSPSRGRWSGRPAGSSASSEDARHGRGGAGHVRDRRRRPIRPVDAALRDASRRPVRSSRARPRATIPISPTRAWPPTRSVNRWWTLTQRGTRVRPPTTRRSHSSPADVDAGARRPTVFVVGKRDGTPGRCRALGTRTATSTQATGHDVVQRLRRR